jgi:WD40 repeat protein/DNA-binding SARP family transcriptional activator
MLELKLLGSPQIILGGRIIHELSAAKSQAFLFYLAMSGPPQSRLALAGLFWPGVREREARGSLRQAVYSLRQVLPDYIVATRSTVTLNQEAPFEVDARLFELEASAGLAGEIEMLQAAAGRYAGPFLAGFYLADAPEFEEWLLMERERLRSLALQVLHRLSVYHAGRRDIGPGLQYTGRLLALEPWHEEAHQQMMRLLAWDGQRSAAPAQYEQCRQRLADELKVAPNAETVALYEQIRDGMLGRGVEEQESRRAGVIVPLLPHSPTRPHLDWGDAPHGVVLYGRQVELSELSKWLADDRCRLVALLGMGGQGKTALAAKLARKLADQFEAVIWRSLLNAPPLAEILQIWLPFLSRQQVSQLPDSLDERLGMLFDYLRQRRCLLILDNLESIMQAGDRAGRFRPGYEDYSQLIRWMGESSHQSCLLLTSRERPKKLARLERVAAREGNRPVRSFQLAGLAPEAGRAILQGEGLAGSAESMAVLIEHYSGNPLALLLVLDTIQDVFGGDIAAFLSQETPIFDDIQDVLDQQFARLSELEREIMFWLAIEREAISVQALAGDLVRPGPWGALLAALRSLQRRSLLEKRGPGFTLQNVIMQYTTGRLIEAVGQALEAEMVPPGPPEGGERGQIPPSRGPGGLVRGDFNRYALMKAQAKEYVRQSQVRLILQPIAGRLLDYLGRVGLEEGVKKWLARLRAEKPLNPGYAGGNILNLLVHLESDLRGYDFSRLAVWQADLRRVVLPEVNFAGSDLAGSVFTDIFSHILSIAFSPDGRLLAARTGDEEVRLWGMADGQLQAVFKAPPNLVWPVVFSPDGHMLASGDSGTTIRLWDPQTGQILQRLAGHTHRVWSMAFSPDGRLLASGSEDRTIPLWDTGTGQICHTLAGHTRAVTAVTFSPDGRLLASGSADQTVRLWDVQTGGGLNILTGHSHRVWSVAFSPDGRSLASGGEDQTIRLWNVATAEALNLGQVGHTLQGHTDRVCAVAFSPDGRTLVSGSDDQTIRLWNADTGQAVNTFRGHTHMVGCIAFSPSGRILASGGWDQTVRLWDIQTGQALQTLQGHRNGVRSIAFSPDGSTLASGGEDQIVWLWDVAAVWELETGQTLRRLQRHSNTVFSVAFSPAGGVLASGGLDQAIFLWDSRTGQLLNTLNWPIHGALSSIAFSPDGYSLTSSSKGQTVPVWDIPGGQIRFTLQGHTNWVGAVAFSPDGRLLASGSEDRTIRLWDMRTGQALQTLRGHHLGVWAVAFSPDGASLASSSGDQTIRLWETQTGQSLKLLTGHTNLVFCLAFSPDGRLLASGSEDQTVHLWEVQTGRVTNTFQGHTNGVWSVAFSPDGQTLASSSGDETIKFWDVRSGVCLKTLRPPGRYAGMNISGAIGLTEAQKAALKALGAVEEA